MSSPLPAHLANRSVEEREALRRRMAREMAIDEARNAEPRRRIDRNARQLYSSAIGTTTFVVLIVLKVQEGVSVLPWTLVLAPLSLQYLSLGILSSHDVWDALVGYRLQRTGHVLELRLHALKTLMAKAHETLWHAMCCLTAPLLALHLDLGEDLGEEERQTRDRTPLAAAFAPVWLYGMVSLVLILGFLAHGIVTNCANETAAANVASLSGGCFGLVVRTLPVFLVVFKIQGDIDVSWPIAFFPLWGAVICLALVGLCVCCIVPVLVLTQDEAGRVLGYIVAIAALFMVIPALCSLVFLVLICQHLALGSPSLAAALSPLLVMNCLLAGLTPLLVRIVNSTHNVIDAFNQPGTGGGEEGGEGGQGPRARVTPYGKRPGVEQVGLELLEPALVFQRAQGGCDLFQRVVVLPVAKPRTEANRQAEPLDPLATVTNPAPAPAPIPGAVHTASPAAPPGFVPAAAAAAAGDESGGGGGGAATIAPPPGVDTASEQQQQQPAAAAAVAVAANHGSAAAPTQGGSSQGGSSLGLVAVPSPKSKQTTEALCYVCCSEGRDSVLQPCGHGGMCYTCAVELASSPLGPRSSDLEAPAKCPLCRAPVKQVFRLAPFKRRTGMPKAAKAAKAAAAEAAVKAAAAGDAAVHGLGASSQGAASGPPPSPGPGYRPREARVSECAGGLLPDTAAAAPLSDDGSGLEEGTKGDANAVAGGAGEAATTVAAGDGGGGSGDGGVGDDDVSSDSGSLAGCSLTHYVASASWTLAATAAEMATGNDNDSTVAPAATTEEQAGGADSLLASWQPGPALRVAAPAATAAAGAETSALAGEQRAPALDSAVSVVTVEMVSASVQAQEAPTTYVE